MRVIELKKEPLNERDILIGVVQNAPEKGYSLEEMRQGVRVLDKLEGAAEKPLALEEPEWAFLIARLRSAKWKVASIDLVGLVDKIVETKETSA